MYLVTARLLPPAGQSIDADAALVTDALWAHAGPAERVEHIRVRAGPDVIDVAAFLSAPDAGTARTTLIRLCRRLIAATDSLSLWRCSVTSLPE